MPKIYGKLLDSLGRCIHYHQITDVVAMKCSACARFYACYYCHNERENHSFLPLVVDELNERATVLCGNCQTELSYYDYIKEKSCSNCRHPFNPNCAKHAAFYFSYSKMSKNE